MNTSKNKVLWGLIGLGVLGLLFVSAVGMAVMYMAGLPSTAGETYSEEGEILGDTSRGVMMKNELSSNTLHFVKNHQLLKGSEKLIALLDVDNTRREIALLTSNGLVYYNRGTITRVRYEEIQKIDVYNRGSDQKSIVLQLKRPGELVKVDIAVQRGAEIWIHLLKKEWHSTR
jgi:hypothetical protein